jgi:hypothetical protein
MATTLAVNKRHRKDFALDVILSNLFELFIQAEFHGENRGRRC